MYLFITKAKATVNLNGKWDTYDLMGCLAQVNDERFDRTDSARLVQTLPYSLQQPVGFYKFRLKKLKER